MIYFLLEKIFDIGKMLFFFYQKVSQQSQFYQKIVPRHNL